MRRTPNLQHVPPMFMLEEPEDNTGKFVYQQVVRSVVDRYTYIHTEIAQEIAAGYATPRGDGLLFQQFADYGVVSTVLTGCIVRMQMKAIRDHDISQFDEEYCMEIMCMDALLLYIRNVGPRT